MLTLGVRRALKHTYKSKLAYKQLLGIQTQKAEAENKFLTVRRSLIKFLKVSQKVEEKWEGPC
jgi:hypothetical protein